MGKDLRCFFKNNRLYCSQEVYDLVERDAVWDPELPLNAGKIAHHFGVVVEVKAPAVLDQMEKEYHQNLHVMAVKKMTESVEALATLFKGLDGRAAPVEGHPNSNERK